MAAINLDPSVNEKKTKLPFTGMLNGLRGFFALCVFCIHMENGRYLCNYSGLKMQAVVLCFFVISSFLLTFSCLSWQPSMTRWRFRLDRNFFSFWGGYFIRRFSKIYPLFMLIVSIACLNRTASESFFQLVKFWDHALFLRGLSIFWTITIEWDFYLILPLIIIPYRWAEELDVKKGNFRRRGVVLLSFWSISLYITFFQSIQSYRYLYYHILPYFPIFWIGSFGAIVYREALRRNLIQNVNMEDDVIRKFGRISLNLSFFANLFCWTSLAALFFTQPYFLVKFGFELGTGHPDILYRNYVGTKSAYICTAVVISMISFVRRRSFNTFFEWSFFVFLGKISYPFYLVHLICIHSISKYTALQGFDGLFVIFGCAIVTSYILHVIIEEPFIKLGQHLVKGIQVKYKKLSNNSSEV